MDIHIEINAIKEALSKEFPDSDFIIIKRDGEDWGGATNILDRDEFVDIIIKYMNTRGVFVTRISDMANKN